jgi:hypothetical protein
MVLRLGKAWAAAWAEGTLGPMIVGNLGVVVDNFTTIIENFAILLGKFITTKSNSKTTNGSWWIENNDISSLWSHA